MMEYFKTPEILIGFPTNNHLVMSQVDTRNAMRVRGEARVEGEPEVKETDYTIWGEGDTVHIKGKYAGAPIDIIGTYPNPINRTIMLYKSQSGVLVDKVVEGTPFGIVGRGEVDGKECREERTLDPDALFTHNLLSVEGQVGALLYTYTLKELSRLKGVVEGKFQGMPDHHLKVDVTVEETRLDSQGRRERKVILTGEHGPVTFHEEVTQGEVPMEVRIGRIKQIPLSQ